MHVENELISFLWSIEQVWNRHSGLQKGQISVSNSQTELYWWPGTWKGRRWPLRTYQHTSQGLRQGVERSDKDHRWTAKRPAENVDWPLAEYARTRKDNQVSKRIKQPTMYSSLNVRFFWLIAFCLIWILKKTLHGSTWTANINGSWDWWRKHLKPTSRRWKKSRTVAIKQRNPSHNEACASSMPSRWSK